MTGDPDVGARPELLRDLDRDTGWTLLVEGAEQSYVDVVDATHLEFEYMQHIALTVDAVFEDERPLSTLHLGGGACTLARWIAATRPGSEQLVVEASQDILDAVRPLGDIRGARIAHDDAVAVLDAEASDSRDLVIWDLYDGPRVVTSSLTLRIFGEMRRVLRDGGLALLNVSDATPFDLVRPVAAGLRVTFDDVTLLSEPSTLRGRRSGNCVLVGASRPLPVPALRRRAAGVPARARVLWGRSLVDFVGGAVPPTEERPLPEPDESVGRGFL